MFFFSESQVDQHRLCSPGIGIDFSASVWFTFSNCLVLSYCLEDICYPLTSHQNGLNFCFLFTIIIFHSSNGGNYYR